MINYTIQIMILWMENHEYEAILQMKIYKTNGRNNCK